jgi:hypothetical protein
LGILVFCCDVKRCYHDHLFEELVRGHGQFQDDGVSSAFDLIACAHDAGELALELAVQFVVAFFCQLTCLSTYFYQESGPPFHVELKFLPCRWHGRCFGFQAFCFQAV